MTAKKLSLFEIAVEEINKLQGVCRTDKNSYRIGAKVFIRFDPSPHNPTFGFKLPLHVAETVCQAHEFCNPMKFGGMGSKGWIDVSITNESQLEVFSTLIRQSRKLFSE